MSLFADLAKDVAKTVLTSVIGGKSSSSSSSQSSTRQKPEIYGDFLYSKAREPKLKDQEQQAPLKSVDPTKSIDEWVELLSSYERGK